MEGATVNKKLLAFLNGIAKRKYFDEEISDEMLRDQVLDGMDRDEYSALVSKFEKLINSIVTSDMDFNQLDIFLQSQMKKKDGYLSSSDAATLTKFWKLQKNKIHEKLVALTTWDNELKSLSWRVDACSKARHISELNQTSAIVEIQLGPPDKKASLVIIV